MAQKELKKLNRRELLEILLDQKNEIARLNRELSAAREKLADRTVRTEKAGDLAEAVLSLNGVYEDVENAARQYLENIRRRDEESRALLAEAEKKAAALVEAAARTAGENGCRE